MSVLEHFFVADSCITAPAHPSATDGRVSGLVYIIDGSNTIRMVILQLQFTFYNWDICFLSVSGWSWKPQHRRRAIRTRSYGSYLAANPGWQIRRQPSPDLHPEGDGNNFPRHRWTLLPNQWIQSDSSPNEWQKAHHFRAPTRPVHVVEMTLLIAVWGAAHENLCVRNN